jgi:hypothetical protein
MPPAKKQVRSAIGRGQGLGLAQAVKGAVLRGFGKPCAWLASALIRRAAMLSTTANPTDGLDSTVPPQASPLVLFIPRGQRGQQAAEWSW